MYNKSLPRLPDTTACKWYVEGRIPVLHTPQEVRMRKNISELPTFEQLKNKPLPPLPPGFPQLINEPIGVVLATTEGLDPQTFSTPTPFDSPNKPRSQELLQIKYQASSYSPDPYYNFFETESLSSTDESFGSPFSRSYDSLISTCNNFFSQRINSLSTTEWAPHKKVQPLSSNWNLKSYPHLTATKSDFSRPASRKHLLKKLSRVWNSLPPNDNIPNTAAKETFVSLETTSEQRIKVYKRKLDHLRSQRTKLYLWARVVKTKGHWSEPDMLGLNKALFDSIEEYDLSRSMSHSTFPLADLDEKDGNSVNSQFVATSSIQDQPNDHPQQMRQLVDESIMKGKHHTKAPYPSENQRMDVLIDETACNQPTLNKVKSIDEAIIVNMMETNEENANISYDHRRSVPLPPSSKSVFRKVKVLSHFIKNDFHNGSSSRIMAGSVPSTLLSHPQVTPREQDVLQTTGPYEFFSKPRDHKHTEMVLKEPLERKSRKLPIPPVR